MTPENDQVFLSIPLKFLHFNPNWNYDAGVLKRQKMVASIIAYSQFLIDLNLLDIALKDIGLVYCRCDSSSKTAH